MVKSKIAYASLAIISLIGLGLFASNGAWAATPEFGVVTRENSLMMVSSFMIALVVGLIVTIAGVVMVLRHFKSND